MRIYAFSEHFVSALTAFTTGYMPVERIDLFIKIGESEIKQHYFTYSSESNLLRIISGMFDKVTFINECITYPHYLEILMLAVVNSNYLSDILVRNPEYFYWILNPSNLNQAPDIKEFEDSVDKSVAALNTFTGKVNTLRRIKRKEILRIGLNDLLGNITIEETTRRLSIIAKVLSAELFKLCHNEVMLKYKIEKLSSTYALVALGKLGGDELNYSSDIDLILFFDKNTKIKNKEYFELLTEAAHMFIDNASSMTDSGYLYRIDFRLRPDGRASLLCRTLQDYLAYYESRGEDWERQMLIKASYCAGDLELYSRFINYLQPFIYPSSFLVSPAEQIKKLKSNIEKNLKTEENIKLASGGIRDIEFAVQALQLLHGGRNKNLRTGNTLQAIAKLKEAGLLSINESEIFTHSYILYRRIEHFLQLMNDKQTHTIPVEGELLEKLSHFLGYKSSNKFYDAFKKNKKEVRVIYNSILMTDNKIEPVTDFNFQNRKKAESDLLFISTGKGLLAEKSFDKNTLAVFNKIEAQLYQFLLNSPDPDKTLRNFSRIIRNVKFPSQWYNSFSDKKFFNSFLFISTYSQRSVDIFAEDDELNEFFLSKNVFEKISNLSYTSLSTKKLLFILSVQYVLGIINENELSSFLSRFIIYRIAVLTPELNVKTPFLIAAAGSLGAEEMNFSSDIDLIFITSGEENVLGLQREFQSLLNKIKSELKPFDADCRLRPEGISSYLVWDLDIYRKYILERCRIWELQSLSKLKYISGDKKIFNDLNKSIIQRIKSEKQESIRREIIEMRKRLYPSGGLSGQDVVNIKKDKGGFLDVEFIIQYFMLNNPGLYKKFQGSTYKKLLTIISSQENIPELLDLLANYRFLKNLLLLNQCIFGSKGYNVTINSATIPMFISSGRIIEKKLKEKLSGILKFNNFLFNKFTGF